MEPIGPPLHAARENGVFLRIGHGRERHIEVAGARLQAEHSAQLEKSLDSLIVVLFVFRLVLSRGGKGYATVLAELWDQCGKLGIAPPQREPVAASSICKANHGRIRPEDVPDNFSRGAAFQHSVATLHCPSFYPNTGSPTAGSGGAPPSYGYCRLLFTVPAGSAPIQAPAPAVA